MSKPKGPYDGVREWTKKDPTWEGYKPTQKELTDFAKPFLKNDPVTIKALLTNKDICEAFVGDDKTAYDSIVHKFISGGLKLANGALNLEGAADFVEAATDLAKDVLADKADDKLAEKVYEGGKVALMGVMGGDEDDAGWKEWRQYDDKEKVLKSYGKGKTETAGKKLYKRLGTSLLVIAIKIVAGVTIATATKGAAIPILLAIGFYFGEKANDAERDRRITMAENAIETYEKIKANSMKRIIEKRNMYAERIVLSNAQHDWEDENRYNVAQYYDYKLRRWVPIKKFDIDILSYLVSRSGRLTQLQQAEVWLEHRRLIEKATLDWSKVIAWKAMDEKDYDNIQDSVDQILELESTYERQKESKARATVANPLPGSTEHSNMRGVNKNPGPPSQSSG